MDLPLRTCRILPLLCALLCCRCAAQQEQPFVVSPLVGDTVDRAEREGYALFPEVEDFQWAVFHINPDSTLRATLRIAREGVGRDTAIRVAHALNHLRVQIALLHERYEAAIAEGVVDAIDSQDEAWRTRRGAMLAISRKDGWKGVGELVSVRDGSILVAPGEDGWTTRFDRRPAVTSIALADIGRIRVAGRRGMTAPIVLGLYSALIGALIGAGMVDEADARGGPYGPQGSPWATVGPFACAGLFVGVAVGAALPGPRRPVAFEPGSDLSALRSLARYQNGEPPYLRAMIP
jgi:hypothetical protein